jgi:hypothetical protein
MFIPQVVEESTMSCLPKYGLPITGWGVTRILSGVWGYASEWQETQGLFLETVVSKLRQGYWKQAQSAVPAKLLTKYYSTVSSTLKKAQEGTIEILQQKSHHSSGEDGKKGPTSPSDETDCLLEAAFASHVQGDYVNARRFFSKVSDTNKEKWGLCSMLLRERQMVGTADCNSKFPTYPSREVHWMLWRMGSMGDFLLGTSRTHLSI